MASGGVPTEVIVPISPEAEPARKRLRRVGRDAQAGEAERDRARGSAPRRRAGTGLRRQQARDEGADQAEDDPARRAPARGSRSSSPTGSRSATTAAVSVPRIITVPGHEVRVDDGEHRRRDDAEADAERGLGDRGDDDDEEGEAVDRPVERRQRGAARRPRVSRHGAPRRTGGWRGRRRKPASAGWVARAPRAAVERRRGRGEAASRAARLSAGAACEFRRCGKSAA